MSNEKEKINIDTIRESLPNYFNSEVIQIKNCVLDSLLKGGIDAGSTIQIIGESGCGKSTISLFMAKSVCEQGKNVVYIDTEGSISKNLIDTVGLSIYMEKENYHFYYLKISTFKEVEEKLDQFFLTNNISLVIIDSLAGLINNGFINLDGGISINNVASSYNSRPLGMFMNKYKVLASKNKVSLIFTNQYRNKIDIKTGTQLKEYGGKNIRYNSDNIIRISNCKDKEFANIVASFSKNFYPGIPYNIELIKSNKRVPISYPFNLVYGRGISNICNYIYALRKLNIIKQNGSYYSIQISNIEIKENGIDKFILRLKSDAINLYEIYKKEIDSFYN